MEDLNMIAADCVVLSCCCQCLVLQLVFFFLLKLPYRVFRKTKSYVEKKLFCRRNEKSIPLKVRCQNEFVGFREMSVRFHEQNFHGCGSCIEEVDNVLQDLYEKGEFGFGRFWSRDTSRSSSAFVAKEFFDSSVIRFELIEIVGPC